MSREIPLSRGLVAIVDDADFDWLNQWKWSATADGPHVYAYRKAHRDGEAIRLHRLILGAPSGRAVDHINGDGLDNRRQNLRLATPAQNAANSRNRKLGPNGYRGVFRREGKWYGKVVANGKHYCSEPFLTAAGAAFERDLYAVELHGTFAVLNFPDALTVWAGHGYTRFLPSADEPNRNSRLTTAAVRVSRATLSERG